jgi:hypothetical protein
VPDSANTRKVCYLDFKQTANRRFSGMQVQVRRPGKAAVRGGSDLRTTVTFTDESLPLPLRVHFVYLQDEDTGVREFRNVGVELGSEIRDVESGVAAPELTALGLRSVVERYPHWLDLARAHAEVDLDRVGGLASSTKRQKPARIDRDWLRMIAAEYSRHLDDGEPAPISTIARSHGVTVSAASRWVKAARKQGLLKEAGGAS